MDRSRSRLKQKGQKGEARTTTKTKTKQIIMMMMMGDPSYQLSVFCSIPFTDWFTITILQLSLQ